MKFTKASEATRTKLRKPSVRRMDRESKAELILAGHQKIETLLSRLPRIAKRDKNKGSQ